jgi:hypothetical protein
MPSSSEGVRRLLARSGLHVLEVYKNRLSSFGAQVDRCAGVFNRAQEGLEHKIELSRLAECTATVWAYFAFELVLTIAFIAILTFDEWVGKAVDVS